MSAPVKQGWLRQVGPGAITASATIGAGETVLAVRAGAWAGYELLWLILLAVVTKSLLTLYLVGRYTYYSGETAIDCLMRLPGPRGWLLWVVFGLEMMVAPFVLVVIAVPCGRLMADLLAAISLPVSYQLLASVFVAVAVVVAATQSFGALEKSQAIVCLILLVGTAAATILVRPDLAAAARGLLSIGSVPDYPDWLPAEFELRSRLLETASVFGYAGSIAVNYLVYSNWVREKNWTAGSGDAAEGKAALRTDVWFNAVTVALVTGSFMLAGAAILKPLERIPAGFDLLSEQAVIFEQISPLLVPLYYVTILVALWGTLNAVPDIYTRGLQNFLSRAFVPLRDLKQRTVMRWFAVIVLALSWTFIWTGTTPIVMVDLVALFSTNLGVGLVAAAALWLDGQLPADQRAPRWLWWTALAAAAVINAMALLSAREVVAGYLG